jgi:anti-anti-sigma factor
MGYVIGERGGVPLVSLREQPALELDCDTLPEHVHRLLAEGDGKVILDLSRVPYLSSVALRMLMCCCRRTAREGGTILLAGPTPPVGRVLRKLIHERVAPLLQSVDDAAAYARGEESYRVWEPTPSFDPAARRRGILVGYVLFLAFMVSVLVAVWWRQGS